MSNETQKYVAEDLFKILDESQQEFSRKHPRRNPQVCLNVMGLPYSPPREGYTKAITTDRYLLDLIRAMGGPPTLECLTAEVIDTQTLQINPVPIYFMGMALDLEKRGFVDTPLYQIDVDMDSTLDEPYGLDFAQRVHLGSITQLPFIFKSLPKQSSYENYKSISDLVLKAMAQKEKR